jgi:hypothetical protein
VARVRAVLRRVQGSVRQPGLILAADLEIDLNGRRVTRSGETIALTRSEFNLLVALAQHPGQAFTREQLLTRLYDVAYDSFARSIDAHIKNLRQKLELVAMNLQGIGVTLVKLGRASEAVRFWGAAQALCATLPEERAFVGRASEIVRTALGEEAFAAAWAQGQAMTLEQAIAAIEQVMQSNQLPAQAVSGTRGTHQQMACEHFCWARSYSMWHGYSHFWSHFIRSGR